jgi:hypothetical protein
VPTRVLLEGPAIEPLLAQVREEYGSGVRIISADKVRSGGFGGFFAKQHYELSVEVPDRDPEETAYRKPSPIRALTTARAQEPPAQTLEELLERAESRDRIMPGLTPLPESHPLEAEATPDPGRGVGMSDTAAAVGRRDIADTGAAFAELMAGLDKAEDLATTIRAKSKPDNQSVRPFRPTQAMGQPVNSGDSGVKPAPHVPSLAELMGGLGMSDSESVAFDQALARTGPPRTPAEAYGVTPASVAPAQSPALRTPTDLRPVANDPVVMNLMAVGMPEAMAAEIIGGDTYAGVLHALAGRPAAPEIPSAPGEILVLAGDLAHIVPIGRQLLNSIGLDHTHLLLAGQTIAGTGLHSSKLIHTPDQAGARAEKMQNADSAWVVMLDAPIGGTDPIWANDMCDSLGATAVWAVVDATRKTADTARHLRTLGEVEALVAHNVELTADPATLLGLDQPIVSLDGKPATPHSWAALLCARIAADVTPMAAAPRRVPRSGR